MSFPLVSRPPRSSCIREALYLAVDISDYELSVVDQPTDHVSLITGGPTWPPGNWKKLSNALDLAYMSGYRNLDTKLLERSARATVLLPNGTLTSERPLEPRLAGQPWHVHRGEKRRKQGLADRIRLTFQTTSAAVRIRFRRLDGSGETVIGFSTTKAGLHFIVSSLCRVTKKISGMPDALDYKVLVPESKLKEPTEADAEQTPNGGGCPPAFFIER